MAEKGQGWKVLLSLGIIALMTVGPYFVTKLIGGGDSGKKVVMAKPSGHSQAVDIKPIEGVRIHAVRNAMDKDRDLSFDFVDENQWARATKALKNEDVTPLCAFEFDAGMSPEEIIPGTFDISVDMKEMGIPPVLYKRMQVWRVAEDGSHYRYSTDIRGDQLCFRSNQNSVILMCLGGAVVLWGNMKAVHAVQEYSMRKFFGIFNDAISLDIDDPEGDFTLYFSFTSTERGGRKDAYMALEKQANKAMARLERETDVEVGKRASEAVTGRRDLKWWERWQLRDQRRAAMEIIDREAILQEKIDNDKEIQELKKNPDFSVPESVSKAIDMVKLANYYLNHIAVVRPLSYNLEVYIVNDFVISENGVCVKRVGGKPFLLINLSKLLTKNGKDWAYNGDVKHGQSVLLTVTHELFHARQQSLYCPVHMGSYAAESTAAVLEKDAARWYYKNKKITANVDGPDNDGLELSPRTKLAAFGRPLEEIMATDKYTILDLGDPDLLYNKTVNEITDNSDVGYTLAYLIEAAREYALDPERSMHFIVEQYPDHGSSFSELLRFGVPLDEGQFDEAWLYFCDKNLSDIQKQQRTVKEQKVREMSECYLIDLTLSEAGAAAKMEVLHGKDHYIRTWDVCIDKMSGKEYNFFVTNRFNKNKISPYVHFFCADTRKDFQKRPDVRTPGNPEVRYLKGPDEVSIAAAVTSYSKQEKPDDYWAVALFKPREIKIQKLFEDRIILELPHVSSVLLNKGLVTGAVITCYFKDGKKLKKTVGADDLTAPVYWDIDGIGDDGGHFALSCHWFYEEDKDHIFESPESDKVTHRMGDVVEEEEESEGTIVETEGPGLEGGYWRLVRTEVDDSKAKQKSGGRVAGNREDNDNGWVSGSNGSYSCFVEWWAWTDWVQERGGRRATNYRVVDTWVRNIDITVPKQQYKPGEAIAFDVTNGPVSIEGDGDRALEHLPSGNVYAYFRSKNGEYDTVHGFVSSGKSAWDEDNPSYDTGQVVWTYSGVLPEEKYVDDNNYWGFVIIHGVKAPYGRMEVKYHYEWVPRQAAPKKAGHWHLSSTYVNTARTGSSSMSGQKGKYTVNGRSIRFDVPKTDYQPGEQVSLRIVHGKMKKSSGEYPWGEGNMSTVQLGECTSISGSLNPRYDAGEAVCVYQGVTPLEGSPGDVGFWIEEKVNNGEDFLTTDYYYEWVDD